MRALDFPFEDYDQHEPAQQAFQEAHPNARYVVLDVQDFGDLYNLLRAFREFPDASLLTPTLEDFVYAKPVAVLDEDPVARIRELRTRVPEGLGEPPPESWPPRCRHCGLKLDVNGPGNPVDMDGRTDCSVLGRQCDLQQGGCFAHHPHEPR